MQKSTLETFIKRYSLNGICEAAHWYSDAEKQTLTAKSHTETKTVILKVILKKWEDVESCQLAVPSSSKVKSMLNPLGDEVSFDLTKIRDKVANFTISDKDCESVCTVAEYDAFPETFDVDTETDNIPEEYDVEIKLSEDFVSRLMKAIAALSDAKDFVLQNNKKGGLDMVINYESTNTNRIRLAVETIEGKDKIDGMVGLSTPVLKSILNTHDDLEKSVLKVSGRGIAVIEFEDELFKTKYFLFSTRQAD